MNFLEGEVNTKTERIDNLETEYKMTKEEFIKRHEKVVAHNKKLEAEANQNATQIVELEDGKKFLKEELITHKEAIRQLTEKIASLQSAPVITKPSPPPGFGSANLLSGSGQICKRETELLDDLEMIKVEKHSLEELCSERLEIITDLKYELQTKKSDAAKENLNSTKLEESRHETEKLRKTLESTVILSNIKNVEKESLGQKLIILQTDLDQHVVMIEHYRSTNTKLNEKVTNLNEKIELLQKEKNKAEIYTPNPNSYSPNNSIFTEKTKEEIAVFKMALEAKQIL